MFKNKIKPGAKESNNKLHGTIVSFSQNKKWGFVRKEGDPSDQSKDRFLHFSHVVDGTPIEKIKAGLEVDYNLSKVKENTQGMVAVNVEINC